MTLPCGRARLRSPHVRGGANVRSGGDGTNRRQMPVVSIASDFMAAIARTAARSMICKIAGGSTHSTSTWWCQARLGSPVRSTPSASSSRSRASRSSSSARVVATNGSMRAPGGPSVIGRRRVARARSAAPRARSPGKSLAVSTPTVLRGRCVAGLDRERTLAMCTRLGVVVRVVREPAQERRCNTACKPTRIPAR